MAKPTFIALTLTVFFTLGCLEDFEFPAYDANKNYCGPEGLFSVPRGSLISDADFNRACYGHDKCYTECGKTKATQDKCDQEFKQTMYDACDDAFDRHMNECDAKAGYNPMKYACIASARARASSCWSQAKTYQVGVSVGGKAVGAYPC
ncbi:MAG: hypothetical protein V1875_01525 [Candidatus Altiarchaeota archaeon]